MASFQAILISLVLATVGAEASAQVLKAGKWGMTLTGVREASDPSNKAVQTELAGIEAALSKALGSANAKVGGQVGGSSPINLKTTECLASATPLEQILIQAPESCKVSNLKSKTGVQVTSICEGSQRKSVYNLNGSGNTKVSGTFVETSLDGKTTYSKGSVSYDWISATCEK